MSRPLPTHGVPARIAIAAELARLILGGRGPERPELLAPVLDDKTQHPARRRTTRRKR